jgi:hypothetical protein
MQILTKDGQAPDKRKRNSFGRIFQVRNLGANCGRQFPPEIRFRSDDEMNPDARFLGPYLLRIVERKGRNYGEGLLWHSIT